MKTYNDIKLNESNKIYKDDANWRKIISYIQDEMDNIGINNAELYHYIESVIPDGRDIEIDKHSLEENVYHTFADLSYSIGFRINDAGEGKVSPGGTYYSSSYINGKFVISMRVDFDPDTYEIVKKHPIKIWAVTYHGGMSVYDSHVVYSTETIMDYANAFFSSIPPNNTKDFTY